jgi:hypothetical protein
LNDATKIVYDEIKSGWEPLSGVSSGKNYGLNVFVQAMIKK